MNDKLPDINQDFSGWYNDVVYKAGLADQAPVRGCMVIMPYGYALWENIQKTLDAKIKETGHQNAAFPLFIPESFLKKEAKHVEGFSPELAVVTHAGGKELEEPLVVRPTSETIIHYMFAQWLHSWRDLPLKINQWCNVVRWEMRTRPFLRTTEFLWQEGHTAHETYQEAHDEVMTMLNVYKEFSEGYLAIPVVAAEKPASERFAGAEITCTIEGLMQDGKALQMGTSHMISQSFAHAFEMTFQDRNGKESYPHLTSWGVTTRLVGALVMTHGDAKGLVMPPRIAPIQIVIIPIMKADNKDSVLEAASIINDMLKNEFRVHVDKRDHETPGAKFYEWELKGVPFRLELGPRDIAAKQAVIVDRLSGVKTPCAFDKLADTLRGMLADMQAQLFERARSRRDSQWHKVDTRKEIEDSIDINPGFYQTGWCKREVCEVVVREFKATVRCVLPEHTTKKCFNCGLPSQADILIAKAY